MGFDVDNYFAEKTDGNTILFYRGNINPDLINQILDTVEDKLVLGNENSKLRKKVYNVLVESLQNLYHHVDSVPDEFDDHLSERFGILSVNKVADGYKVITGNFVRNSLVGTLEERLKKINESSHEEITELYKFILNHQRISPKGGGGLGLVDIARKTGNKLIYSFKEYDDKLCFFYLNIFIGNKTDSN
jgi:hypothetical protein